MRVAQQGECSIAKDMIFFVIGAKYAAKQNKRAPEWAVAASPPPCNVRLYLVLKQ